MADQVTIKVVKMSPTTGRTQRKYGQKSKIITSILKLLSRESQNSDDRSTGPEDADFIIEGKQLNSELIIQPPAYGKFSTVLQLREVLVRRNIKQVLVKVYGTKIQILLEENSSADQNWRKHGEDDMKQRNTHPGLNVIKKLANLLKKNNTEKENMNECGNTPDEQDMIHSQKK